METEQSFYETVDSSAALNADYARIYPTVVIEETELAELYQKGEYKPLALADAVARCAYGYIVLMSADCEVIRMGLHDSPSVKESSIAGAYHPAMGDMVKTVVIENYYKTGSVLEVAPQYLNVAYGYKGYLKNMHKGSVVLKDDCKPDFREITNKIMEKYGEDNKRNLQEQIASYAKRLVDQTDD